MNTFIFYATIVCLAIAGGAKCNASGNRVVDKNFVEGDSNIVFYIMERQSSAGYNSHKRGNEKVKSLVEKCRENGLRDDAYEMTQKGLRDFYTCLDTRNVTEIIRKLIDLELEDIRGMDGSLFKSACKKVPDWKYCGENYTQSLRECLNYEENDLLSTVQVTTFELEAFLCSNDGNDISAFFASGGVDCILDRQSGINECLNTLSNSLTRKTEPVSFDSLISSIKFSKGQCEDFRQLQYCVVSELGQCSDRMTSKLVNSLAELILINTPCMKFRSFHKSRIE